MSLESISNLTSAARRGGYAFGYFESWNLESLQGVLDAAEETRAPGKGASATGHCRAATRTRRAQ